MTPGQWEVFGVLWMAAGQVFVAVLIMALIFPSASAHLAAFFTVLHEIRVELPGHAAARHRQHVAELTEAEVLATQTILAPPQPCSECEDLSS